MVDMKRFENDINGVSSYWNDLMPTMTCEECGELIQALSKYLRVKKMHTMSEPTSVSATTINKAIFNITDEIGDLYISLGAIQKYLGISDEAVYGRIEYKLNKKY